MTHSCSTYKYDNLDVGQLCIKRPSSLTWNVQLSCPWHFSCTSSVTRSRQPMYSSSLTQRPRRIRPSSALMILTWKPGEQLAWKFSRKQNSVPGRGSSVDAGVVLNSAPNHMKFFLEMHSKQKGVFYLRFTASASLVKFRSHITHFWRDWLCLLKKSK